MEWRIFTNIFFIRFREPFFFGLLLRCGYSSVSTDKHTSDGEVGKKNVTPRVDDIEHMKICQKSPRQ